MLLSYFQFVSFLLAFSLMSLHNSIRKSCCMGSQDIAHIHYPKGWTNNLGMNMCVVCVNKVKTWLLDIPAFLDLPVFITLKDGPIISG